MTAAPPAFPVAPRYPSALAMIGNTPLVEVRRLDTGPCRLFLKLENQNPGGSIKDRIGRSMIEAAEADGRLKPGGTIIEATAGNTGLGLALVAAQKGYRLVIVVPDGDSPEDVMSLGSVRGAQALLVQRPRLADLVRSGLPGVGTGGTDLFEVRTRVASAVQYV